MRRKIPTDLGEGGSALLGVGRLYGARHGGGPRGPGAGGERGGAGHDRARAAPAHRRRVPQQAEQVQDGQGLFPTWPQRGYTRPANPAPRRIGMLTLPARPVISKNLPILLANPLQRSRSTFSRENFPSFFAFKKGMWGTQISALLSSPTVSGGFSRHDERLSRPLGEPCHVPMGGSVPDFIHY
jgi:hypothetical protein